MSPRSSKNFPVKAKWLSTEELVSESRRPKVSKTRWLVMVKDPPVKSARSRSVPAKKRGRGSKYDLTPVPFSDSRSYISSHDGNLLDGFRVQVVFDVNGKLLVLEAVPGAELS